MDSRDIIIIGLVGVGAWLWWRSRGGSTTVPLPAGAGTTSNMTSSGAAATTAPASTSARAGLTNQLGLPAASNVGGFFAVNMGPTRFLGSTALAVVADAIEPSPVTRPPIQSSPTVVGGAGVFPVGANTMGPLPPRTTIINPTRY